MENYNLKLKTSDIIQTPLKTNQIMGGIYDKNQIVMHHTVSGDFPRNVASWWNRTKPRIATAILIGHDGRAYQCFSSKKWAHHLGITRKFLKSKGFSDYSIRNYTLNRHSIGVEFCNWGGLKYKNGNWYNSYDKKISTSKVIKYDTKFRGYNGFEMYTDKQIEKFLQLAYYWHKTYNIPLHYNKNMWDVNLDALSGESGIWTHVSFRHDKSDCHPQLELIEALKYLEKVVYNTNTEVNHNILKDEELLKLEKYVSDINKIISSMDEILGEKTLDKHGKHYDQLIRDLSLLIQ